VLELMHPALLRSSGWKYTGRARDLMAAQWANVLDKFDELPKHKRIEIVALYEITWRMDAVNAYEAKQRAKAESRRARR